jgi:hypothetical protein
MKMGDTLLIEVFLLLLLLLLPCCAPQTTAVIKSLSVCSPQIFPHYAPDPKYFAPLLNYLRTNRLIVDDGVNLEGVLEEAKVSSIAPERKVF